MEDNKRPKAYRGNLATIAAVKTHFKDPIGSFIQETIISVYCSIRHSGQLVHPDFLQVDKMATATLMQMQESLHCVVYKKYKGV